jgi:glycosyltransferase involved in cell wall biosynthesis
MTPTLSVVMPIHNEAPHLRRTIAALLAALERSDFDPELILVDDGSTDGSVRVVRDAVGDRIPLRVISQPNRGRFEARRAGVEDARAKLVLLLDGRVAIAGDALEFVEERVRAGEDVWTSHVEIEADGNLFALYWQLLAELAWGDYFRRPTTTSFTAQQFDRYPKGTTSFLAPKALLLDGIHAFRTRYADPRHANDDTPLIRWIAERKAIHISPRYGSSYRPRGSLGAFARHSFHRGVVFLDGHGRRESRFFPLVVAFYPLSVMLVLAAVRRPRIAPGVIALAALGGAMLGVACRRSRLEVLSLGALTPVYTAFHGAGMWRGLFMRRARPR